MSLRVVHVTTTGQPIAGAERLLVDAATHARDHGWDLAFVTLGPRGALHDLVEAAGCTAHALDATSPAAAPRAVLGLRRVLRETRPDVVHAHLHHASVLAALAALGTGVPLVHTRHYSDYMQRFGGPLARRLDAWSARRAARVTAVSDAARDQLVREGVAPERIAVVRNGVDVARIDALDRDLGRRTLLGLGLGDGPFVGCAATHHPRKGHRVLVDAFARVVEEVPSARLVLLGHGPDRAKTEACVRERGLEGRVAVLGHHLHGHEVMSVLDVYVQPSIEEGFGLAVVEAMAMARPVVASDVGGMRETVVDGVTGLRVPPGDDGALAAAVLRVLRDPGLARRTGAEGRSRAMDNYSIAAMLAGFDRCYHEATGGP